MTQEPRLEQLAAVLKKAAATIEQQSAQVTTLAGRMDSLESRLLASQALHSQGAERVERLASELDQRPAMESLAAQLSALRASQADAGERLEALASAVARLARVDDALAELRREMVGQGEAEARARQQDASALRQAQHRDIAELGAQVHALREIEQSARELRDRLTAAERRQSEGAAASAALANRLDELAASRSEIDETIRRSDLRAETRLSGLAERIDQLAGEVAQWRARIDAQTEAVREARGVADAMRAEAERMATAQHALTEAERLFEDRLQAALRDLRADLEHAREQAQQASDRRLSALADDLAAGDRAVLAIQSSLADMAQQALALERAIAREDAVRSEADRSLRTDVVGLLLALQSAVVQALDLVEAGLPQGQRSPVAAERRDAVRQALKARRDEPAG